MNFFNMKGAYNAPMAWLYDRIIAQAIDPLYDVLAGFFFADLPPGETLLDVGCGSGQVAAKIAQLNPEAKITGLDLAPGQIQRAKKRGELLPNVVFQTGDAMALPFEDGAFDTVISVASIKHWPDPKKGISELSRVAKNAGRVFVIEVDTQCSDEDAQKFVDQWRLTLPGTRNLRRKWFKRFVAGQGYSREDLEKTVTCNAFQSVYIQKTPGLPLLVAMAVKTDHL